MENENLKSYLTNYKKFDILIDKDNIFSDYQVANIIENNWLVPNKDDFIEECVDFYLELVELALNYQESNTIGANMLKQSIIDKLIFMINSYMAIKYKNGVRLNQNAINYKTYLDREYYDQFQFILLSDGQENIWTIIFKSAQLFRSVALEVAREMEYSYPKKEDVKTMESLRNIYNGV